MNFLTTKETASLVRRPESTLRRWRSAGKGPPCYKLEGQWAYVEEEVIEWVRANRFSVRDEHFEREGGACQSIEEMARHSITMTLNGTARDIEDRPSRTQNRRQDCLNRS